MGIVGSRFMRRAMIIPQNSSPVQSWNTLMESFMNARYLAWRCWIMAGAVAEFLGKPSMSRNRFWRHWKTRLRSIPFCARRGEGH